MDTLNDFCKLYILNEVKKWLPIHCLWTCQFVNKEWASLLWTSQDKTRAIPGCVYPKSILIQHALIERQPIDNNNNDHHNKIGYISWLLSVTKYPVNSEDILFAVQSGDIELVDWLQKVYPDTYPPPCRELIIASILGKNINMMRRYAKMFPYINPEFCVKYSFFNRSRKYKHYPLHNCYDSKLEYTLVEDQYHEGNHPIDAEFTIKFILKDKELKLCYFFKTICYELLCNYYVTTNNGRKYETYRRKLPFYERAYSSAIQHACIWTREASCLPIVQYCIDNTFKHSTEPDKITAEERGEAEILLETHYTHNFGIVCEYTIRSGDLSVIRYWTSHPLLSDNLLNHEDPVSSQIIAKKWILQYRDNTENITLDATQQILDEFVKDRGKDNLFMNIEQDKLMIKMRNRPSITLENAIKLYADYTGEMKPDTVWDSLSILISRGATVKQISSLFLEKYPSVVKTTAFSLLKLAILYSNKNILGYAKMTQKYNPVLQTKDEYDRIMSLVNCAVASGSINNLNYVLENMCSQNREIWCKNVQVGWTEGLLYIQDRIKDKWPLSRLESAIYSKNKKRKVSNLK
jgi:hypothetical protein